jgi:hypothetical protein
LAERAIKWRQGNRVGALWGASDRLANKGEYVSGTEAFELERSRWSHARWLSLMTSVIAFVGLLLSSSADAAPIAGGSFAFSHTFATEGGVGHGIGVDPETGDVLTTGEGGIAIYDPNAAPADPPISVIPAGATYGLAVAPNGDIYASMSYEERVVRYLRNPGSPPTYTEDPTYSPKLLNSSPIALDPSTGDLLIPRENLIVRINHAGNEVSSFRPKGLGLIVVGALAVSQDGTVFAYSNDGERDRENRTKVNRYTPSGTFLGSYFLPPPKAYFEFIYPESLSYDPINNVVDVTYSQPGLPTQVVGLNSAGQVVYRFSYPEQVLTAAGAVDPSSGRYYGIGGNPVGVQVFESTLYPGAEVPTVTSITPTSAHVVAEVDPGAVPPPGSFAYFEYSSDGGQNWSSTPEQDDSTATRIEADLTDLTPNLKYLVRAVARTESANHTTDSQAFLTASVPPIIATDPATQVLETSAILNGRVNPTGQATSYRFEYGPTPSYGASVPQFGEATAGTGHGARFFSSKVTGLVPGESYHFRIVATNSSGSSVGEDQMFTTAAFGEEAVRRYEQVTPVDKNGGTINGTVGFQVSADGSALSYNVVSASGASSSPLDARFVSSRRSENWLSHPTDPPLLPSNWTIFWLTLGVSSEFSHAFVVTNKALTPGAIEEGCNLYVYNVASGTYTLVATANEPIQDFADTGKAGKFQGGTADFSTVIFSSGVSFLPGVSGVQLYRWTGAGGLELASRLPSGGIPKASWIEGGVGSGPVRFNSTNADSVYFALSGSAEAGVYLNRSGDIRPVSVSERAGDPTTPQPGEVLAVSDNGRYMFFDAYSAQLTEDSPPGPNNLYRYDSVTGTLKWIGVYSGNAGLAVTDAAGDTLAFSSPSGVELWRNGQLMPVAPFGVSQGSGFITPNGRWVAYARGAEEEYDVFLFDASTGASECVTCRADGSETHASELTPGTYLVSHYQPSPIDAAGDLFFTSKASLVAGDVNGTKDVYEFSKGRLSLISPGNQPYKAVLAAVASDGQNVYFSTVQSLVSQDTDGSIDIYDARLGGGLPGQNSVAPQRCGGADCREVVPAARLGSQPLASEGVRGTGNVKQAKPHTCPKGKKRMKRRGSVKCVKRHHPPKKAKRHRNMNSKSNRGQGR